QAGGSYSIPGPTITMAPGNKYVLRFHNTLPYEPLSLEHNVFKDPNVANLHTHGLHISGESPGDDITRSFEGGFGGDFVYDIPADHMGGTYWYHAHHHGSTYLQAAGGAFGLLIIDDGGDGIPANVAAMTEKQIVLGFLDTTAAGTGGDTMMSGTLSPAWTVNGVIGGNIEAQPDTWQHWRVVIADPDAKIKLVEFGEECEVALLARDGVWRTSAPKMISGNAINLTGASRADFAVRVSGTSQLEIEGDVVATITTVGTPDSTVHPFAPDGVSMWAALRPNYLRDLRNETNVNIESVSMGARNVNGDKWDVDDPTFITLADSVQEWSLSGAKNHPLHLHIYHVQAMESTNDDFEAGEYYDTVAANIDVRFDLSSATSSPFEGRTVLHCHILGHEDLGAMGWMDVYGGTPPPTYPLDGDIPAPYSDYYSLVSIEPIVVPGGGKTADGVVTAGQLSDLFDSDDLYLFIDPEPTSNPFKQKIEYIVQQNSPTASPTEYRFRLEAKMLGGPSGDVMQSMELWNYNTSSFEVADLRPMAVNDTVVEYSATGDLTRFVNPVTGEMTAMVTFNSFDWIAQPFFWTVELDQLVWIIE
ncbi:MAG: multicopper oxidase family protein, partial [Pirellulaceae bacterium]